ncbi:hypothetical protein Drose_27140 [Dactylosporangium roseum]|uniref:PKD domain-containing protein n=1 Tax=Dactylosporangium roseum TaxID=47989 RepID=A0ABY5Z184_9ACTN|nr:hypothetical protein [Dactylosporangium roseum]UWZ34843.1 hypothetical protein Drose_27140 [Dactylosporangium roseum]
MRLRTAVLTTALTITATALAAGAVTPTAAMAAPVTVPLNVVDWDQPVPSCDGTPHSDTKVGTVTVTRAAGGVDVTVDLTGGGVSTGSVYSIVVWEEAPVCAGRSIAEWDEGTDGRGAVTAPLPLPYVNTLPGGGTITLGDGQGTERLVVVLYLHGGDNSGPVFVAGPIPLPGTAPEPGPNTPPRVYAGADQTVTGTSTVNLAGTVTDDGRPAPPRLTRRWSLVSGPAPVTFADATAAATRAVMPVAGTYTLRLTASDGQLTASDTVVIRVRERYRIELRAWIPQEAVVDPIHPVPLPLQANSLDSRSACGYVGGPLVQSSTFSGDDHVGYDGSTAGTVKPFRGQISTEFIWDGTSISGFTAGTGEYGTSHRVFRLTKDGDTSTCEAVQTADRAASTRQLNPATVRLTLSTAMPMIALSPTIDSDLLVGFSNARKLTVYAHTDMFPSHGFRIYKNDAIIYTRVTRNVSCVPVLGWPGFWSLVSGLNWMGNNVTVTIDTAAPPATIMPACRPRLP